MTKINDHFNKFFQDLHKYGSKNFEEIGFKKEDNQLVPYVKPSPNFFIWLIRLIFLGGYNELKAAKKVRDFIYNNKTLINNQSLKSFEKIPEFKKDPEISKKYSAFVQQVLNIQKARPKIIDVKDDGNCLFYAIAIGLKDLYANNLLIQQKLGWDIDIDITKPIPQKTLQFFAKVLRQQAASYLEEHQEKDNIALALTEGMLSHQDALQKKIDDDNALVALLKNEAQGHDLAAMQKEVKKEQANLDALQGFQSYINATKEDKVFGGVAQLLAISEEYGIPIRVIYNYGTDHPTTQTFSDNPALKPLTLAHVNGNHFQYIPG